MPVDMEVIRDMVDHPDMPNEVIALALAGLSIQDRAEINAALTPAEAASPVWEYLQVQMQRQDVAALNQQAQDLLNLLQEDMLGQQHQDIDDIIALGGQIEQAVADGGGGGGGGGGGNLGPDQPIVPDPGPEDPDENNPEGPEGPEIGD